MSKLQAGAKGPRRFEWAAVPINHPYDPRRWQRGVLLRRSCSDPQDLAFYLAFGVRREKGARILWEEGIPSAHDKSRRRLG